ncbi:MAG: PIG-L deacetylase family protein [Rhodothermales bacterium]|nr:PIG-L deacetylase family protein [Rhodothermales bacterium]
MSAPPKSEFADPNDVFDGRLVVLAPHMDDEVLACGATLATIRDKSNLFVIFATDGSKSPAPEFRWQGQPRSDLPEVRRTEATKALGVLGVKPDQLVFLDLPDGRLHQHVDELYGLLKDHLDHIDPDHILIPFRYDRHPDHLALHAAAKRAGRELRAQFAEYFVYSRWRLLPGGDIRSFVRDELLVKIDAEPVRDMKLRSLTCYVSQTTCWEAWQQRPILKKERVEFVAGDPERFLLADSAIDDARIFKTWGAVIPVIHFVEPVLKGWKERIKALVPYSRS